MESSLRKQPSMHRIRAVSLQLQFLLCAKRVSSHCGYRDAELLLSVVLHSTGMQVFCYTAKRNELKESIRASIPLQMWTLARHSKGYVGVDFADIFRSSQPGMFVVLVAGSDPAQPPFPPGGTTPGEWCIQSRVRSSSRHVFECTATSCILPKSHNAWVLHIPHPHASAPDWLDCEISPTPSSA